MWENLKLGCVYALVFSICLFALSFVSAWILMLLWNWIMPDLFGLAALTYWKAFGIGWMCTLLFKSTNIQWK